MESITKPLVSNTLINNLNIPEPWQQWWESSSADRFYVNDLFILKLANAD